MSTAQNALPILIPADMISDRVFLFISDSANPVSSEYQLASIHCYQETNQNAFYKLWNGDIQPDVVLLINAKLDYTELMKLLSEQNIPVIFYSSKFDSTLKELAVKLKVDDYLYGPIHEDFIKHIDLLKKIKTFKSSLKANGEPSSTSINLSQFQLPSKKMWRLKRTIDIIASLAGLVILSPIMIVVALIIKLESKGPVFYISKRSGSGYKVFDFYKFRTMRLGSDNELINLKDSNQYGNAPGEAIFFKIKNDPRITRVGQFLRNTSLDELPQLLNVLKGDMSLVGNRPLPLYEAEQLTRDLIAARFLAPAGITGLWQVTKRGKDNMSPEERIQLDIEYALKNSFLFDMKILLKTFFAVFQKEKV